MECYRSLRPERGKLQQGLRYPQNIFWGQRKGRAPRLAGWVGRILEGVVDLPGEEEAKEGSDGKESKS